MNKMFENMINRLSVMPEETMIKECMTLKPNIIKDIPVRYRIIAMGFVRHLSLDELNEKLNEVGCEQLYARNFKEASLIYAFRHQLSYREWTELSLTSEKYIGSVLNGKIYQGRSCTANDLKTYIMNYSRKAEDKLFTGNQTVLLNQQLSRMHNTEDFYQFLTDNKDSFSKVREKARYYFCKYLLYFLEYRIDQCDKYLDKNIARVLRFDIRKIGKITKEECYDCALSLSGLYDEFNYFYFGYPDLDWMDVLLDYYGNIESLPKEQKKELATALRRYNPEWEKFSDQKILELELKKQKETENDMDKLYAIGAQDSQIKSRNGEKMIRHFLNGEKDIDRTSLICYLLFFGQDMQKINPMYLSAERLNRILLNCGYTSLNSKNEFDSFILEFIKSPERATYLVDTITEYAQKEQNFYLYHMYFNTYSNNRLIEKYLS